MTHSHVPKFSNWDGDNIPYTAYFDNARKEKAIGNPNDPEENPRAFNQYIRGVEKDDDEALKASTLIHSFSSSSLEQINREEERRNTKRPSHHRSKGNQGSYMAESASERSNSDHSVIQKVKLGLRESIGGSHSIIDNVKHEATLVPEFGAWDVTDPNSAEGYTIIFSEIRKEKQIVSHHIPSTSKTPSLNSCSNIQSQCGRPSSILSKYCCCLFSSESK